MAAKKTKKPKQLKATWERGYNGHSLWQGKHRIGKVTVHASKDAKHHASKGANHKYTWQAGTRQGTADTLERAKKDVEFAALVADKQRDLFE